jgi:hypothetical protein
VNYMPKLTVPLKVHCWGGLGSQLFAVILYLELGNRFPNRRIVLCLHEGGVTQRHSEISGIFNGISTQEISDYTTPQLSSSETKISIDNVLKSLLKKLLVSFKILLTLEQSANIDSVRPWTISIRGHYSYRKLEKESINLLLSRLTTAGSDRFRVVSANNISLGLHYRLGDLLELSTKKPLDINRLTRLLTEMLDREPINSLTVFSDSPTKATSLLAKELPGVIATNIDLPTWETIGALSKSHNFVGTFSKVSLWVVVFRYFSNEVLPSFMPVEAKQNLELILGKTLDPARIYFYD